jgi:hypothetical protein
MKKLFFSTFISFIVLISFQNARGSWYAPQGLPADAVVYSFISLGDSLLANTGNWLYYTTDGGETWAQYDNNSYYSFGRTFLVNDSVMLSYGSTFFTVSTNRGKNWTQGYMPNGVQMYSGTMLGDTVFAATNAGVYRMTDSAGIWIGKQSGLLGWYVGAIASVGKKLLAGVYGGGMFNSTDGGSHWSPDDSGLTDAYVDLMTSFGDTLYCATDSSVFRSVDGGASWSELGGLQGSRVHCFAASGDLIYAGTDSGAYLFTANGGRWTAANTGLVMAVNTIIAWGGNIYAGTNAGAYYTPATGRTNWNPVRMTMTGSDIYALVAKDTELFAGVSEGFIFRSSDDGESWVSTSNGLPANDEINALAVSDSFLFAAVWGGGIYRSSDDGATWVLQDKPDSATINGQVNTVYANGRNVYTGTTNYFYYSSDNGESWHSNNGVRDVEGITIHDGRLYVANGSNIYRLMDDSVHWETENSGIKNIYIHMLYSYNGDIYAGTTDGIFRSSDDGANWMAVNKGLSVQSNISCLVSNDPDLFAGDYYNGAFVSTNRGATWVPINDGLGDFQIEVMTINDGYIFAGGYYGVYRRPLYEILNGVEENSGTIPSETSLTNYPDPFAAGTTIEYQLPRRDHVTLNVYDALGREVATLVNEERDAGTYRVPFTAQGLQPGMYFYRLLAGSDMRTGRMAVVR